MLQYPHHLFCCEASESVLENGSWTDSELAWKRVGVCRVEPDGKGTQFSLAGGKWINASSTIYLPLSCKAAIEKGSLLKVCRDAEGTDIIDQGTCLRCSWGQMNIRIWI